VLAALPPTSTTRPPTNAAAAQGGGGSSGSSEAEPAVEASSATGTHRYASRLRVVSAVSLALVASILRTP
jgi:hypothetical protein